MKDNNRKYDVFVSYSRKDSEIVDRICHIMNQKQIRFYRDTKEIPGGSFFFEELAEAICDSCVFLYIGSDNSYNSIYTPKEVSFAIAEKKNTIIPFLIDKTPLPRNLRLAFSDLNVRNIFEHSEDVVIADIIEAVPRLQQISALPPKEMGINDIIFRPHYREAIANYEFAERYYYDDRYEKYLNMRKAVVANAKYASLRGYSARGEWLLNEATYGDSELKDFIEKEFEKSTETIAIRNEAENDEKRRQVIIQKIKQRIPIAEIMFVDEYSDKNILHIFDETGVTNVNIKKKLITINGCELRLIKVDGGQFIMGASKHKGGETEDEQNERRVRIDSFYISETVVTQKLWQSIMHSNPTNEEGLYYPVYNVSWFECQDFISKLNSLTGLYFRLPYESEWEYAAKGGMLGKTNDFKYSGGNDLYSVLWAKENSNSKIQPVASKRPNQLEIYDLSGNVWEWCEDWYGCTSTEFQDNPKGPDDGNEKICKGGSFLSIGKDCRISKRESENPSDRGLDIGFRIVIPADMIDNKY